MGLSFSSIVALATSFHFSLPVIPSRPEPEARMSEESAVLLLQTQIPRSARDDKK
jgi:hypothetical protein